MKDTCMRATFTIIKSFREFEPALLFACILHGDGIYSILDLSEMTFRSPPDYLDQLAPVVKAGVFFCSAPPFRGVTFSLVPCPADKHNG